MLDNNHRVINYLRISVTDRCNLQCRYCVPQELIPKLSHAEILTYEEILRLVKIEKAISGFIFLPVMQSATHLWDLLLSPAPGQPVTQPPGLHFSLPFHPGL